MANKVNIGMSNKQKIATLRERHEKDFEKLGVIDALYIPKMIFGEPPKLLFFRSELEFKKDIYTERVSQDYDVLDVERTLYVWKHNSNYKDELETKAYGDDVMYYIPFTEFSQVSINKEAEKFEIPNPNDDAPFSEFMIRDLAAIMWKKPVSQKRWLNDLVKQIK
tara:strand:+ start:128 stop:622 length:495 start_codon:yes stop_codon:yes gene_type:complete